MESPSPDLSIIIPVLNEEAELPATLDSISGHQCAVERIVVDGGSRDRTLEIAREAACRILVSDRARRSRQMNLGARSGVADALLFLHADSRLPPGAADRIVECLKEGNRVGGGFVRIFDSDSKLLEFTCRLSAWRSRTFGLFLGDQGIFVRRDCFESLGGFDESLEIAEDLDFSRRLGKSGRLIALEGPVVSSARRFRERGPMLQSLRDFWLATKFLAGR